MFYGKSSCYSHEAKCTKYVLFYDLAFCFLIFHEELYKFFVNLESFLIVD